LITELERKMNNKNILRKRSLIEQEWHLALEVPTSKMAHAERERDREREREGENTPAKQHQGKA
jgi:hypothetical protein